MNTERYSPRTRKLLEDGGGPETGSLLSWVMLTHHPSQLQMSTTLHHTAPSLTPRSTLEPPTLIKKERHLRHQVGKYVRKQLAIRDTSEG